jgi:hypothetical protein
MVPVRHVPTVMPSKLQAPPEPEIIGLYPSPEDPVAVIVKNAFHSSEGMALEDLKRCIQKHHGRSLLEHRPFAYGVDGQEHKGGNDCTFLGGFLQFFAPGVAAQVKRVGHLAWETAQWGDMAMDHYSGTNKPYKDPMKAGIRTSGHLSYQGWDELGPHSDSESLYTVLLHLIVSPRLRWRRNLHASTQSTPYSQRRGCW